VARVAIAGAGLGGLAAALFVARRGHVVTLLERDEAAPRGDPTRDFAGWRRPGIPQARQPHVFLARGRQVLAEEAPGVLAAVMGEGHGRELRPLAAFAGLEAEPGDEELWGIGMRRPVFEPFLRRAVSAQGAIEFLAGVSVEGLVADAAVNGTPRVTGVRTSTGDIVDADLVVDAGGRRSALPAWLAELDARAPVEHSQDLRFVYASRWYQLPSGAAVKVASTVFDELGYATAIVFPADDGVVSFTLALSMDDPLRRMVRDPDRFDRVAFEAPAMRPWLEAGAQPISGVLFMARIENRSRRLVDEQGPVAAGIVVVGDAALHTNPTLGRGASMAFLHGQYVADTIQRAVQDPVGYAVEFDKWTTEHLGPWYEQQVRIDGERLARVEAALRGDRLPPAPAQLALLAARSDPLVARAMAQFQMMVGSPHEPAAPELAARIAQAAPSLPPVSISRTRFEQLLVG
jgi:flavin-dependent dehydrogenase